MMIDCFYFGDISEKEQGFLDIRFHIMMTNPAHSNTLKTQLL